MNMTNNSINSIEDKLHKKGTLNGYIHKNNQQLLIIEYYKLKNMRQNIKAPRPAIITNKSKKKSQ